MPTDTSVHSFLILECALLEVLSAKQRQGIYSGFFFNLEILELIRLKLPGLCILNAIILNIEPKYI